MDFHPLAFDSTLDQYQQQAEELLVRYRAGDPEAIRLFNQLHPRFLDDKIVWLQRDVSDDEVSGAGLDVDDARLALARGYSFRDWPALVEYAQAVAEKNSRAFRFESAAEAVIEGELRALGSLLTEDRELVHVRSTRATCFDPPVHRATLLHYVGANGVEGHRQKTPPNAVEVANALLEAGAEVDAVANMHGSPCTTMSMLVSSDHPARAGLQVALVETLLDFGAAIEGRSDAQWGSPLMTALAFGYPDAAEALVRRGARVDHLAAAAGLGRVAEARQLLPAADGPTRHRSLALAAQLGHADVVRLLLDAGEDPSRYNPEGHHSHSTPLHQAVSAGHEPVVRLLVERGARLDVKDTIYQGTPLGWAVYGGKRDIEKYLRSQGAV